MCIYQSQSPNLATILNYKGFPCGSAGKESACNVGDLVSIPGLGESPGEGKGYPLQCSGELETNLRPQWGLKESDPAEQLSLSALMGLPHESSHVSAHGGPSLSSIFIGS